MTITGQVRAPHLGMNKPRRIEPPTFDNVSDSKKVVEMKDFHKPVTRPTAKKAGYQSLAPGRTFLRRQLHRELATGRIGWFRENNNEFVVLPKPPTAAEYGKPILHLKQ